MATNVSVEFAAAESKYDKAVTNEEKLIALTEMKSTAPSHKGCESLRAEINRKISALKSSMERQKSQSKKGSAPTMFVKKDGLGQIIIIGMPNTGKSWLLNKLVGKKITEETNYEFATFKPEPGMMPYEGGLIQLVELPALIQGSASGKAQGKEIISLARNSDGMIILGDAVQQEVVKKELFESKIYYNRVRPPISVKASDFRGIQVSGKEFLKFPLDQLINYLKTVGFSNSSVIITGTLNSINDVSEALNESIVYKRAIFLNAYELTDHNLTDLKDQIFLLLNKVLVYTKKPSQEAKLIDPLALPKGATLSVLAEHLHKDFAKKLKFAKVWGSTKFPGQRVGPDYELKNKDIVEINI